MIIRDSMSPEGEGVANVSANDNLWDLQDSPYGFGKEL